MGCILAEAGRREETLLQIEENLERFPGDIWVVINAGDAMYSLGDKEQAEKFFQKAYNMADRKDDKASVLERMIDLYRDMGMTEKEDACKAEDRTLTAKSE